MEILIADDEKSSRLILDRLITRWGHTTIECDNGVKAWEILNGDSPPRIAVLDWVMPHLSGVDLCRRLHTRRNSIFIYTILLTSKNEDDEISIALESGIHDILSKPLKPNRLLSRIKVAERILNYETKLQLQNQKLAEYSSEMESLAESRAQALVHADRMSTLGTMSAGIAHEINNPNSFISGNIQTLQSFWDEIDPLIKASLETGTGDTSKLKFIQEETPRVLNGALNGVKRISTIVKSLKTFAHADDSDMEECDLNSIIEESVELCHIKLKNRIDLIQSIPNSSPSLFGNPQQISQVIVNLLVNAADAIQESRSTASTEKGTIWLEVKSGQNSVIITIRDDGPGIPQKLLDTIWNPFFTTKEIGKGTGLGLSISRSIIETHKGTLEAINSIEGGAKFTITLPIEKHEEQES